MNQRVYVSGVGMIPFVKPGTSASYDQMGMTAGRLALDDAGISYDDIEQAYVGYVYGDSTAGQKALYQIGMSGIRSAISSAPSRWKVASSPSRR